MLLKNSSNNLKTILWFLRALVASRGYKAADSFATFLCCVGCGTNDSVPPKHSGFFDANSVFQSFLNLLLNHYGDIDKDIFISLMRVINDFERDGDSLMRFVIILMCAKEGNNTVPAKIFAKLLKQFAYLNKNVDWTSKNFASIINYEHSDDYKGFDICKINYDVMKKIKEESLDTKEFVDKLAATDPKSFSPKEFAESQSIEKVVIGYSLPHHL